MFNERDRRCADTQLMLSNDPSHENRTSASTLKIQIWIATNNSDVSRVMKRKFPATVMVFGVLSSEDHIMPLTSSKSAWKSTPKCTWISWRVVQSGGRWQTLGVATGLSETQAWLQEKCYDFVPLSHWPLSLPNLNPLNYFVWSWVENITNMTSHNTKISLIAAIHRVFTGLPPALVEKACSQFRSRIEAVIEAEGGYIE